VRLAWVRNAYSRWLEEATTHTLIDDDASCGALLLDPVFITGDDADVTCEKCAAMLRELREFEKAFRRD
jgi:hypothetical protein